MDSNINLSEPQFPQIPIFRGNGESVRTYIIHMDKSVMPDEFSSYVDWYKSMVLSVKGISVEDDNLYVHIYNATMHGFTVRLTESQVDMLKKMPGCLSAFPQTLGISLSSDSSSMAQESKESVRRIYIVYMDKSVMPVEFSSYVDWYKSVLSSVKGVSVEDDNLYAYIYHTVMDGFSASLTESQVDMLKKMPGCLAVVPDSCGRLLTTHSSEFMGLDFYG
ncbi:hypothetical protein SUGI_0819830 [Cryptomeria japonica]|nr:hypothetical protein SUGI_0819830 [Cryptomeria japonica]